MHESQLHCILHLLGTIHKTTMLLRIIVIGWASRPIGILEILMLTNLTKTSLSFSSLHIVNIAHIIKWTIWANLTANYNFICNKVLIYHPLTYLTTVKLVPVSATSEPVFSDLIQTKISAGWISNNSFIISVENFVNFSKFIRWIIIY